MEGAGQARKLGLKPGLRVALDGAPLGWRFADPPDGLLAAADGEPADVVVAFVGEAASLTERLPGLVSRILPASALWIAWPRRAGGHTSDLTDSVVRDAVLATGLVDVKVAAIDDNWSGLKFVWRVARRP